jgi:hypothetical protein
MEMLLMPENETNSHAKAVRVSKAVLRVKSCKMSLTNLNTPRLKSDPVNHDTRLYSSPSWQIGD